MESYQNYQSGQDNPYRQYPTPPQQYPQPVQPQPQPQPQTKSSRKGSGESKAQNALILGIISTVTVFFGYTAILSIVLGIVSLVLRSKAKALGYDGSERDAALVLSIIGIAGGFISLAVTVAFLVLGAMSWLSFLYW